MNNITGKAAPVLILKDTDNGKGVFAGKDFKKGDMLFEVQGQLFTLEELPYPYEEGEDRWMQVGDNLFLGPTGDFDDYINHSCDPNTGIKIEQTDRQTDRQTVCWVVIREIQEGEEITWDYSTTMYNDDWEMQCKCGSENCRERIREFKYLPQNVQQKYIRLGVVPDYIVNNIGKNDRL